jgi:mono/diheme cytochrome c family protein
MRTALTAIAGALLGLVLVAAAALGYARVSGLESRSAPGPIETRVSRMTRRVAVPADLRLQPNPVASTPEALAEGRSHFADHCASCHANDGSGNTELGRGFYPKAPDMRLAATQDLTDGELFWVIENGIRFTGMPAWSTGTKAGEESSWRLVQFIRHLPALTPAELDAMTQLNPRSPAEIRQEIEEDRFLSEGAQR